MTEWLVPKRHRFFCESKIKIMKSENKLPKRKIPRLREFDYNSTALYFTTICVQHRKCLLSNIVGTGVPDCPQVELTQYGKIADKYIRQLNDFYDHISIEDYVIMPNHIHMVIFVRENGQSRTPVPTTKANSEYSKFISAFKRFCNKEYGHNIWQSRSHEHIIRNHYDYEEIAKYIHENPLKWHIDELFCE